MRSANDDEVVVAFDMTPARKELYSTVSGEIIDLFKRHKISPPEAHALLGNIREGLERIYGIRVSGMTPNATEMKQ